MPFIMPFRLNHSGGAAELPVVRNPRFPRRAGVLAAAIAAGVLCAAAPASADVTVSPPSVTRGEGVDLTFHVVNDHRVALTKVRLVLPPATPIAEVYPLSVPDWGPQIASRTLAKPVESIHGGTPVTEATASITWVAAPGKALQPGAATDLSIAIGPMPEVDRMSFEIQPTYADGSAGPAIAPVALTLTPAVAAPPVAEAFVYEPEGTPDGPGWSSVAGWIVALLTAAGGVFMLMRSRRPDETDDADVSDDASSKTAPDTADLSSEAADPAQAAHKARVTAWSYRDTP
jgi:hypothetical protein